MVAIDGVCVRVLVVVYVCVWCNEEVVMVVLLW